MSNAAFYPLVSGSNNTVFFWMEDPSSKEGKTGLTASSFTVKWCAPGGTSFTNISSDNGGVSTNIHEIGLGWYTYLIGSSRISDGVNLYTFESSGGTTGSVLGSTLTSSIIEGVFGKVIESSKSFGDIIRGITSILAGPVSDFETGTLLFKSLNGLKTRFTIVTTSNGRGTPTIGDLT